MSGQRIVCVLGMHRSGTSLLTRMLNLLGLQLGAAELLTTEPVVSNPTGYWENRELTAINDAILTRYHGKWDQPPRLKPGWQMDVTLDDVKYRASKMISSYFAQEQIWGWKDPRTCLTLPFWQAVVGEMRYVICWRHPLSVAASLARRDNFTAEKSCYLWLTYMRQALKNTEDKLRMFIFYQDLIDDCNESLRKLATFIDVPLQADLLNAASQFIEPDLQHHGEKLESRNSTSEIESCAVLVYEGVRQGSLPDGKQYEQIEKLLERFERRPWWRLKARY